jgi:hypothetical protein
MIAAWPTPAPPPDPSLGGEAITRLADVIEAAAVELERMLERRSIPR